MNSFFFFSFFFSYHLISSDLRPPTSGLPRSGFHGLMRGMSIQLVDLVGPNGQADGLIDLILGYVCYHNVGTSEWPLYRESDRTVLHPFAYFDTESLSLTRNIATSYHFADFDLDGDLDAVVTGNGFHSGRIHLLRNVGNSGAPSFENWGEGVDTISEPHITELLDNWGGDITVADFDHDGRMDVLVTGDALFVNRGSTTPKLEHLGQNKFTFAGTKMNRETLQNVALHAVYNFTRAKDDNTLSLLWVDSKTNGASSSATPTLRISKQIIARDEPAQEMTPWVGKVDFPPNEPKALQSYGKSSWSGIRLGNSGDMNGDGRADWITSEGNIFVATSSMNVEDPAFEYWKQIPSSLSRQDFELLNGVPPTFWTFTIIAASFTEENTEEKGVAVTQAASGGAVSGILTQTLEGRSITTITVTAARGQAFDTSADLVIGATTIKVANVTNAESVECSTNNPSSPLWSPGDVNNDGLMDLFLGVATRYTPSRCNGDWSEKIRLTYFKNVGTLAAPSWSRIRHGESGYPLGDVYFETASVGSSLAPVLGDVNGDGYVDLVVSQNKKGDWGFDQARLFINNQDGTFTEDIAKAPYNRNMLPTNEELKQSNAIDTSPSYITGNVHYVPLTLIDWNGNGYSDLYFSSGDFRLDGALFVNRLEKWIAAAVSPTNKPFLSTKATNSIILGEKQSGANGCETSTAPPGWLFVDTANQVAWRVYPRAGQASPIVQMYTMLPRCKLPGAQEGGTTCGTGLCSTPVPGVQYGFSCQCPSWYMGDNDVLPLFFNNYCATCSTGAFNSKFGVCTACTPGRWSDTTFSATNPSLQTLQTACKECGAGRVGPETMSSLESNCIECNAGKHSTMLIAATMNACINCAVGQFSSSGESSCHACSTGQWQTLGGQASCLECYGGQFGDGLSECKSCPVGWFQLQTGQSGCKSCPVGRKQPLQKQASCLPCIPSEYNDELGQSQCKDCAANEYTNITEQTSCKSCGVGETSVPGSASCQPCSAGEAGTPCTPCVGGTFRAGSDKDTSTCDQCPAGWHQPDDGQGSCLPCIPGTFNNELGQEQCKDCAANTFTINSTQMFCTNCPHGKNSDPGSSMCQACPAGTAGASCDACTEGKFRSGSDNPETCRDCPNGYFQSLTRQASCLPCIPGTYGDGVGELSCKQCQVNSFTNETARAFCSLCAIGKSSEAGSPVCQACVAGKAGASCALCVEGKFRVGSDPQAAYCHSCPKGFYQRSKASASCLSCLPGFSQNEIGRLSCEICPAGKLQPDSGKSDCDLVPEGKIVGNGGSSWVTVPPGAFISDHCDSSNSDCTPFKVCPAGRIGTRDRLSCDACPAGYSSLRGSEACRTCSKGKFNDKVDGAECQACRPGYFQPHEDKPMSFCYSCPAGWAQERSGESSCRSLGWLQKEDCSDAEYLDDINKTNPSLWKCTSCPAGASCKGDIDWSGVHTLFGWARCKGQPHSNLLYNTTDLFKRCSFAAACLGKENKLVESDFILPPNMTREEKCSEGYLDPSRMCHACKSGYSHAGDLSGRCSKCPKNEENIAASTLGSFFGLIGLAVYLFMAISDGGQKDFGDALKMILLNYMQMLFLLTTFPIEWPEIFSVIFQVGGAITSLGQHVVNLKCLMSTWSDAEVFYLQAIAWSLIPIALCLAIGLFWLGAFIFTRYNSHGCFYRCRVHHAIQKWHVASVAVLYLLYPTLCASAFSLFSCRTVCDDHSLFLRADLDEKCYVSGERHQMMAFGLGLPMLLLYVVGMPMMAYVFVWRLRRRAVRAVKKMPKEENTAEHHLARPSVVHRILKRSKKSKRKISMQQDESFAVYGMLFSMFREDTWFWEITVCWRKVVLAAIGVFGGQLGDLQIHVTSAFLMVIILFTAIVRPFDHGKKGRVLQSLELASLVSIWLTLWAGSVFISYPKCRLLHGSERNAKNPGYMSDEMSRLGTDTKVIAWCETMALSIGSLDILLVIICVGLVIHDAYASYQKKKQQAQLRAEKDALIELIEWQSNPSNSSNPASVGRSILDIVSTAGGGGSIFSGTSPRNFQEGSNMDGIDLSKIDVGGPHEDDDDDLGDADDKRPISPRFAQLNRVKSLNQMKEKSREFKMNQRSQLKSMSDNVAQLKALSGNGVAVALSPAISKTKRKTTGMKRLQDDVKDQMGAAQTRGHHTRTISKLQSSTEEHF